MNQGKIQWKPLIVSLIISLGVGALSAAASMNSKDVYAMLNKPPLSPPAIVFPIVWTILFILMGISAYLIFVSNSSNKKSALTVYAVQLIVNFFWPILFFGQHAYLFSFFWLLLLWVLVIVMIVQFYRIKPLAAYLQIPYLLWVTFAGYLNIMIYFLN